MSRPRVFVTRHIPRAGIDLLKGKVALTAREQDTLLTRTQLLRRVKGIDALLCLLTDRIDSRLMDTAGPNLKIIANYAVGFDNIDVAAATKRGILVTNTPGVLSDAVAEHAMALIMAATRHIAEADRFVRAGKYTHWESELFLGADLTGKTLGIIGLGNIGSGVAVRVERGLEMRVIYTDLKRDVAFERRYNARYATLPALLRRADVVTLHVPLLPSTRHLIGAAELRKMKKTAYLINTSRGPVVDERALVAALKARRIAGAALDVFENEPKLALGLRRLENVTLTPHIASATHEARNAMAVLAAKNILAALAGRKPLTLVNPAAWPHRRQP